MAAETMVSGAIPMTLRQEQQLPRSSQGEASRPETRKPYAKPEIIHELELETRAGSLLGMPDPFDPLSLGLPKY